MSCKWDGRDRPRVIAARHGDDCAGEGCAGCLACTEPHCRVCRRAHADQTCAECLASSRDDLREISRMCDSLPEEVEHRGVEGEAMMLLAPATDPERRGYMEASVLSGRLDKFDSDGVLIRPGMDSLETSHAKGCKDPRCTGCAGELHPLFVLGTWEMVWRDHLEAPTELRATLDRLVDYLDRNLHIMAAEPLVPFEDFAGDVRRCRGHLEAVLHDQNQGDRANVGCFECGGELERKLTTAGFEDVWTCQKCRQRYTYAEYNFALRASLEAAIEETA